MLKLFLSLILSSTSILFAQENLGFSYEHRKIGERLSVIPSTYKLMGISSKNNSHMYRYINNINTTVFSYSIDKFEITTLNGVIVHIHFILFPKDSYSGTVPTELIDKVKAKSNIEPIVSKSKGSFAFDDATSRTVIMRANYPEYGGDRIHILIYDPEFLSK